jgi:hypothetical protein
MRFTNALFSSLGIALGFALSVGIVLNVGEAALLPAIQTIGSIAVAFSATVAFGIYLSTVRRHQHDDAREASKTYLQESVSLLEKAYELFTQKGTDPPANDRLLWLSTARMIVRFQRMRERISEADHLSVVDENEEYVRLKFYTLLGRNQDNFTQAYFCPSGDLYSPDNVARNSIAVVFGFSRWRERTPDPISDVDDVELLARGALPIDQGGAQAYLEGYTEYWQKVKERKAQLEAANDI